MDRNSDLTDPLADAAWASNEFTARWVEELDLASADALIGGFSAWHLLSVLALGANGPAKDELEAATGIALLGEKGLDDAIASIAEDISNGLGIWVREGIPVLTSFMADHPRTTVAPLPSDLGALNQWLSDATGGVLTEFPSAVTADTLLLVASALGIDMDWAEPFTAGPFRWATDAQEDGWRWTGLTRQQTTRDDVSVISHDETTICSYRCRGTGNVDVYLVAGEPTDSGNQVLQAAIAWLQGEAQASSIDDMKVGTAIGCMTIERVTGSSDKVIVSVPQFSLLGDHDLTSSPQLFGLKSALDNSSGHFSELSPEPLAVERVGQVGMAEFSATGFRAGAVTYAAVMAGSAYREETKTTQVTVKFDRPFGFLVVHRPTNLVLFAGWIATTESFISENL